MSLADKQKEGQARWECALKLSGGLIRRLLVVDDETKSCEDILGLVRACGADGEYVVSGDKALEKLRREHFDLVLLDMKMPGMNGIEVMQELMQFKPNQCVVLVTAYADSTLIEDALRLGIVTVMVKPVTIDQMERLLKRGVI